VIRVAVQNIEGDAVVIDTVASFYMEPAGKGEPGTYNWKVWAEHPGPNPGAADAWVFCAPEGDPVATAGAAARALDKRGATRLCRV
jgi:hypothetical protein